MKATTAKRAVAVQAPRGGGADSALDAVRAGDSEAWQRLVPSVYPELRSLAGRYFAAEGSGHTLQPTALVNEAFLRLEAASSKDWENRSQFLAAAARCMRQILIEMARARCSQKRGGGRGRVTLSEASGGEDRTVEALALDDALCALADRHPRQAQVVEFRFFGGMNHQEVARVLGVSVGTIKADWRVARAWLRSQLRVGLAG